MVIDDALKITESMVENYLRSYTANYNKMQLLPIGILIEVLKQAWLLHFLNYFSREETRKTKGVEKSGGKK